MSQTMRMSLIRAYSDSPLESQCRYYVCRAKFGDTTVCQKLTDDVSRSSSRSSSGTSGSVDSVGSFQPVCGVPEVLDQFFLSMRQVSASPIVSIQTPASSI